MVLLAPELTTPVAIGLGAISGALSRYYINALVSRRLQSHFPFGTLAVNLSGAMLMGFFSTLFLHHFLSSLALQRLILTGFLGSYTTFSTYALDTLTLIEAQKRMQALLYWAGSALLGGLSLELGAVLAERISSL